MPLLQEVLLWICVTRPKEASWLSTWDLAQELGAVQWQSGVQDSQVTLLQS